MRLFNFFINKKLLLLNILLAFYVLINIIGGDRGLVAFYEKKNKQQTLIKKEKLLTEKLTEYEKKNRLLSTNLNLDYVDMIYREKLKFGKKDELIIKLK